MRLEQPTSRELMGRERKGSCTRRVGSPRLDVLHVAGRFVFVTRLVAVDRAHLVVIIIILVRIFRRVFRGILLHVLCRTLDRISVFLKPTYP